MLLLKFACIILKAPSRKQSLLYFHMTRARYERHPDAIMPMQCSIYVAITWHHFGFAKYSRCWDIFEKHTYVYIHTNKQTWPGPVFHRLLDSGSAPSALSLRLKKCAMMFFVSLRLWLSLSLCHTHMLLLQCRLWLSLCHTHMLLRYSVAFDYHCVTLICYCYSVAVTVITH